MPESEAKKIFQEDPDLDKEPDPDNIYDELVPHLPKYEVVKNEKKIGFTKVNLLSNKYIYKRSKLNL